MLSSLLGIRLTLWLGKTIPLPAPYEVMCAVSHVKVINEGDGNDGFQITFTLGRDKVADYGLLASGALDPDQRVAIGLLLGTSPEPLINGVIYHHQVSPSNEPGLSTFTVTGRDVSVLLDLEEKNDQFKNQPDFVIVNGILNNYAGDGVVPPHQVTPTTDVPLEIQRVTRQHETDLQFLRRLAQRNGFVFYLEPRTLGVTGAYWGAESRLGLPQPALSINLGQATNVTSLNFHARCAGAGGHQGQLRRAGHEDQPADPTAAVAARAAAGAAAGVAAAHDAAALLRPPGSGPGGAAPRWPPSWMRPTRLSSPANWTPCAMAACSAPAAWSACAARGSPSTACTTSAGSPMRSTFSRPGVPSPSHSNAKEPARCCRWCEHERRVLRQVPGHRDRHPGPADAGADSGSGSGRDGRPGEQLGHAVRPFGGRGMGFFALPDVGAGVWMEFECGDPEYPIWSGCWWGSAEEIPPQLLAPPYTKVMLKTAGGHSITLDDTPGTGGITLATVGGQKIVLNSLGIEINNGNGGTIKLTGPLVSVNDDALEVM